MAIGRSSISQQIKKPNTKKIEHTTSEKITNSKLTFEPIPKGSGNELESCEYFFNFGKPCA